MLILQPALAIKAKVKMDPGVRWDDGKSDEGNGNDWTNHDTRRLRLASSERNASMRSK
jgi:hypothetical protein